MAVMKSARLCFVVCLVFAGSRSFEFNSSFKKSGFKPLSKITNTEIEKSIEYSVGCIDKIHRLEENILNAQISAHKQITVSNADDDGREIAKNALIIEKATTKLISRFCNKIKSSPKKCVSIINKYNATSSNEQSLHYECLSLSQDCTNEQKSSKYRSLPGKCNHGNYASLGQSLTTYKRLLQPVYGDGIHTIRRSVFKKFALPSARFVCDKLIKRETDDMPNSADFTVAFAHWGEFIEHDLAQTVSSKMIHFDSSINCCTPDGMTLSPRHRHPFCDFIEVPLDDKFYKNKFVTCLNYVRSTGGLRNDCSFGPTDQLNQATHYLDSSNIYGNNVEHMKSLRNGIRGQMHNIKNNLPKTEHTKINEMNCREDDCFISGDSRVNSNPQLTVLHTLFLREHNRIAEELSKINPHWNDEKLFQEARKIVIAEIQYITYEEWLPLLLPKEEVLKIKSQSYQETVDPTVSNSFATAAIRVFKSMIPENIQLLNEDRSINSSLKLGAHLYKTKIVENVGLDYFLRGLTTQKARNLDLSYTKDIVDLSNSELLGLDVISLDIQRGRDHGLPGYNAYRKLCGLKSAKVFDDLLDNIPVEIVKMLSDVYKHPDDIDLIIGGLSEKPLNNSKLGETLTYIISDQFKRTRMGDRFFYSFVKETNESTFTPQQLAEIKKTGLAKIICENSNINALQTNVFLTVSGINLTKCEDLPNIDLTQWQK